MNSKIPPFEESNSTTITCPLDEASRRFAQDPALCWGSRWISWSRLNNYVNTTVKSLKERGIKPSDRVALVCENSVEMVIVLLALWRMRCVACVLNPKFPPDNIHSLLSRLNARAVICGGLKSFTAPRTSVCPSIVITDLINHNVKEGLGVNESGPGLIVNLDSPAVIVLTSGSSGEAKAAVLSYGNLYFNALGSNTFISVEKDDRWLLSLPLYHVSGLGILMRCLLSGAGIVVASQREMMDLIGQNKITHVSLVATQLFRLLKVDGLNRGPYDLQPSQSGGALKAILLGGSAVAQTLIDQALDKSLPIYMSYGLTEMASQVATQRVLSGGGNCVRVLPGREIKIAPDGEICVRGKTLFLGYLEGDRFRLPLDSDGWFKTGDVGSLDQDGCLTVTGRKDLMFISAGENIHPQEIERALLNIDGIEEAVVFAQSDPEFGARPAAVIKWREEIKSDDFVNEQLLRHLPKFKIPAAYFCWPEDVDAVTQDKINRAALIARFI